MYKLDNKMNQLAYFSAKIVYNNITKRIGEIPPTLSDLKMNICQLFEIKSLENFVLFAEKSKGMLHDDDGSISNQERVKILTDNDYQNIIGNAKSNIKFHLEQKESDERLKKILSILDEKCNHFEMNVSKMMEDCISKSVVNSNIPNTSTYSYLYAPAKSSNVNELLDINNNNHYSNLTTEYKFNTQCSICLVYPIMNTQYVCVICNDLILCENCEKFHNHPLIKFKPGEFTSKEDICNLIANDPTPSPNSLSSIMKTKQGFLTGIKDRLLGQNKLRAVLSVKQGDKISMKPNTTYQIIVRIINEGVYSFPQDTVVFFKNTSDISFEAKRLRQLLCPKDSMDLEVSVTTGGVFGSTEIEVHIYHREIKIDYIPCKFVVKISNDKDFIGEMREFTEISLSNPGFNPEDSVSTLPFEKKEVLAEVIRKDLSVKDIKEICEILSRHDWKLTESAMNELK